jgi:N-acetyl sugar amidotransferase
MKYKICAQCVMDTSDPDIEFFTDGSCSNCRKYEIVSSRDLHYKEGGESRIQRLISNIKKSRKFSEYDCLIGLSGGVDSSYVAYLVTKKYGLRALAVHLDNGWNTELAVSNVEKIVKTLGIDLSTVVLNWPEFSDIQKSFIKSGVSNIEIPTDHAIWAVLIRTAAKHRIPYIIAGNNVVTESIMPKAWLYGSKDFKLIQGIHKRHGVRCVKSYPSLSTWDYIRYLFLKRIRWIPILNYIEYNKQNAKQILINELGWRDYGGKHYESVFTRYFHADYLPSRFGYDLRRSYLSALICSKQITRSQALDELLQPPADSMTIKRDREYVLKKLDISVADYQEIINSPTKIYSDYPNSETLWSRLSWLVNIARAIITRV